MAFTCDYGQRKRKHEIQNLKKEMELEKEYATQKAQETEIDTYLTDEIICPYCGAENYDESGEPDDKTSCQDCGKEFMFQRDYTVKYISSKIE